jgi:hypothetical protein
LAAAAATTMRAAVIYSRLFFFFSLGAFGPETASFCRFQEVLSALAARSAQPDERSVSLHVPHCQFEASLSSHGSTHHLRPPLPSFTCGRGHY